MKKFFGILVFVFAMTMSMSAVFAAANASATNKNETGILGANNSMSKAVNGQTVHGNYQNNTNSCASCHKTHTAEATKNLLFKSSASEACEACHDGTMGFYDVMNLGHNKGAGTFESTPGMNGSNHDVTGTVALSAAPGAKVTAGTGTSNWSNKLECDSCHNPHGSYSDRLLSASPTVNFVSSTYGDTTIWGIDRQYLNAEQAVGNKWGTVTVTATQASPLVAASVASAAELKNALGTPGLAPGKDLAAAWVTVDKSAGSYYELDKNVTAGDVIIQFYKFDGANWVPTPYATTKAMTASMKVSGTQVKQTSDKFTLVNNIRGYLKVTGTPSVPAFTEVVIPIVVKVATKLASPVVSVNGVYEMEADLDAQYGGAKMNNVLAYAEFCGSCHTNYYGTGHGPTGADGQQLYHHTVASTSNGRSCGYCHFAHGTDVTIMKDAKGRDYKTIAVQDGITEAAAMDYLKDVNPSSALKRFTNMSVCYGCHTSSHYGALGNNGTTGPGTYSGLGNGIKQGVPTGTNTNW